LAESPEGKAKNSMQKAESRLSLSFQAQPAATGWSQPQL
jgi:hypothetical protein